MRFTQWQQLQGHPREETLGVDTYIIGIFPITAYLHWKFCEMNANILIYNSRLTISGLFS